MTRFPTIMGECLHSAQMGFCMPGWEMVVQREIHLAMGRIPRPCSERFFDWTSTRPSPMLFRQTIHLEMKSGRMAYGIRGDFRLISPPVTYILAMWVRMPGRRLIFSRRVRPAAQTLAGTSARVRMITRVVDRQAWWIPLPNIAIRRAAARSQADMYIVGPWLSGMAFTFTRITAKV